jgi:glucans biosynthesis protein
MKRREFLLGVAILPCLSVAAGAQEQQQPAPPPPPPVDIFADGAPFSREALEEYARQLATRGHEAPASTLPNGFADLPRDVFNTIRMLPERTPWGTENRGFTLDLMPGGSIYRQPVRIASIDDSKVRPFDARGSWFDFGRAPKPNPDQPYPLSGFAVRTPLDKPEELREAAVFQGATIYRALARGQIFGTSSRGLAIDTGEPNGEEFPMFRAFWIERPAPGSNALVVHALLDSRRLTGAYRFTLRPGEITVVDVELTLFARETLSHIGVGPMTSMFLFGPNDRAGVDDIRGQVHRSDGLQMWTGSGEWLWRPLTNPRDLQISVFTDQNPRGFGLLQRERFFPAYNDLGRRYDRMPSAWIEPIGDWGPGQLQLLEIPTDTDINENIVAYWRPKQPLEGGQRLSMAYRMNWCWTPPDRPTNAVVGQTVIGTAGGRRRRFVVDFVGDAVADPAKAQGVRVNVSTSVGQIREPLGRYNPETKGHRVTFDLDPGDDDLCELRMLLETDGGPISETWLYRWTP